jgi:hypothetical protein
MSRRAGTALMIVIGSPAIGAYLAAVSCPVGWWGSVDLGSGSARLGGGALVGAVVAWIIRLCTVSRPKPQEGAAISHSGFRQGTWERPPLDGPRDNEPHH